MDDPATKPYRNALDALKLVLGTVGGKHKKSKTKCQQKKKESLRETLYVPKPGTLRQVSRFKFIRTGGSFPELINLKGALKSIQVIEADSKIGSKYCAKGKK